MDNHNIKKKINQIIQKFEKNDFIAAEKVAKKLVKIKSDDEQIKNIYATILYKLKKFDKAIIIFKKILKLNPLFYNAQYNIANLYYEIEDFKNAEKALYECLKINQNLIDPYLLLGNLNVKLNKFNEAEKNYILAISVNAKDYRSYFNLGNLFKKKKIYKEAIAYYKKSIDCNPRNFTCYNNIATLYLDHGEYDLAIKNFKKVIKLNPGFLGAYSNYLYCLNFYEKFPKNEYLLVLEKLKKNISKKNLSIKKVVKKEKINVGFVSGDFGIHPVSFFLINLIKKINKNIFSLYAYSNSSRNDLMTKAIKKTFNKWTQIDLIKDEEAVKVIKEDNIDVLFDLSGHTAHNRLSIFANKAAPVQVTWLGYNASTGIDEMDYILVDPHVISENSKEFFSEKLLYMPKTFQAINFDETTKVLNQKKDQNIIYGCFNRFSKINTEVIKVWSEILNQNKNSKIFLKSYEFLDVYFKNKILDKFKFFKISEKQIILDGKEYSRNELLNLYNKIDIMLDTFPYTGVTTSIEAIWMGVPVLTLVGERYYSRIGYSINKNLKLDDWNAFNKDQYVKIALDKAKNYDDLIKLKKILRNKIENSPIFDLDNFSKNFEDLLLKISN